MITMMNLFLERLSDEHKEMVFVHSYPGFVDTGNLKRGWGVDSWKSFALDMALRPALWVKGIGIEESGERHLFLLTSGGFGGDVDKKMKNSKGGEGPGLFLVDESCEVQYREKVMEQLRGKALEVVGETMKVLKPYM
jgi:hypothetical protein